LLTGQEQEVVQGRACVACRYLVPMYMQGTCMPQWQCCCKWLATMLLCSMCTCLNAGHRVCGPNKMHETAKVGPLILTEGVGVTLPSATAQQAGAHSDAGQLWHSPTRQVRLLTFGRNLRPGLPVSELEFLHYSCTCMPPCRPSNWCQAASGKPSSCTGLTAAAAISTWGRASRAGHTLAGPVGWLYPPCPPAPVPVTFIVTWGP
jgi:hypothetical protein